MQSFLMLFYILDQGYDQCKKDNLLDDDLGIFLGKISPELCGNGKPIDEAVLIDWEKMNKLEVVDMNNIREKIYSFLEYYEQELDYNFSETKQWLLTKTDKMTVRKAYENSRLMYVKYQYTN